MEKGTTLVVNSQADHLAEDYTVWAPANLIYYPESRSGRDIQPAIYAALLTQDTIEKAIMHVGQEYDTRRASIHTYKNYRKVLVLSQPTPASCVQVMNGDQTEFSSAENARVMLLAPYSRPQDVIPGSKFAVPPYFPFGAEPVHDWCYYYEKGRLCPPGRRLANRPRFG